MKDGKRRNKASEYYLCRSSLFSVRTLTLRDSFN